MRAADLPALLSLQERGSVAALAHVFPQDVYPFPGDAVRERWIAELADPDIAAYVATAGSANGGLVAYAASSGDELLHFGTAFETWGSGLAVWGHDQFVATFPREKDPLRLRVFEENHRARRFYEKLGWIPTGSRSTSGFPPYPALLEYALAVDAVRRDAGQDPQD